MKGKNTKGKEDGKGKSAGSGGEKFSGYCGSCSKWGHKSTTCWWTESGKPSGPPTTSVRAATASQEQGPANPSRNALCSNDTTWCVAITDVKTCSGLQASSEHAWGLIDLGSVVTAVGWDVGSQFDAAHVAQAKRPRLTNVSGALRLATVARRY